MFVYQAPGDRLIWGRLTNFMCAQDQKIMFSYLVIFLFKLHALCRNHDNAFVTEDNPLKKLKYFHAYILKRSTILGWKRLI